VEWLIGGSLPRSSLEVRVLLRRPIKEFAVLEKQVRTIFISDFHLGTAHSQASRLLDFLQMHHAETIYLVGDIFDFWAMERRAHWKPEHSMVINELMAKTVSGTEIIYIPGNHDEVMRVLAGSELSSHGHGGIDIQREAIHETAKGLDYLVIHGDEFDTVIRKAKWLAHVGDWLYDWALRQNGRINFIRSCLGHKEPWSFSAWAKHKVKEAVAFIGHYETAVAERARDEGVNGVICGHIHHAADKEFGGIHYLNCGDFVESCTAIIEEYDGTLHVVKA
jgi:UDP-2,3-diacylglucosamine pyrophosphatase LpxH